MAYGINITDAAGLLQLDTSSMGAVFIEKLNLTYGNSGSKTYPNLNGMTLRIFQLGAWSHAIETSVVSGNPKVTWTAQTRRFASNSAILVFAA